MGWSGFLDTGPYKVFESNGLASVYEGFLFDKRELHRVGPGHLIGCLVQNPLTSRLSAVLSLDQGG